MTELIDIKTPVLDHGFVRLVEYMGGDVSIARAARNSYDAAWRAGEDEGSDTKLLRYLMRNSHTSPFEAVVMTFEVKAPIFVFRQWHRHRTWSYNELSARYRPLPDEFYVPASDSIGIQSKSNKQMRDMDKRHPHADSVRWEIIQMQDACYKKYKELLEADVPRELARSVLPVSIYSNMFATVDLHNLFHFMELRLHEHAQYEIRMYAEALLGLAYIVAPVSVAAFREYRLSQEP